MIIHGLCNFSLSSVVGISRFEVRKISEYRLLVLVRLPSGIRSVVYLETSLLKWEYM